jgi:hypothetical protein
MNDVLYYTIDCIKIKIPYLSIQTKYFKGKRKDSAIDRQIGLFFLCLKSPGIITEKTNNY